MVNTTVTYNAGKQLEYIDFLFLLDDIMELYVTGFECLYQEFIMYSREGGRVSNAVSSSLSIL